VPADGFTIIRDPLWNNIQIDGGALKVIDTEPFQRLRYVRQLGHAFLVYPTANHTRFEHAIGTYHLARRALTILGERGDLRDIPEEQSSLVPLAALLHDLGHYPFSHALEEAGLPSHEDLVRRHFQHPGLRDALRATGLEDVDTCLYALIAGTSANPLQGLISGSLDLDKLEYLTRDARMCGVPYGAVDVDRLLHALTVVEFPGGTRAVGVHEKGISALESLLFARYQMYRNVYWHHAVRSATAMFKRAVRGAIARKELSVGEIADAADEDLMQRLRAMDDNVIAMRLRHRHLYKRVADIAGEDAPRGAGDWIADHPDLTERVENQLARELGLEAGELLLDFPAKATMLEADMPMLGSDDSIQPLDAMQHTGHLGILRMADALHAKARRLRVFAATSCDVDVRSLLGVIERTAGEIAGDLEAERGLLTGRV